MEKIEDKPAKQLGLRFNRRHKAQPGECSYCDREREHKNEFHPPHDASRGCESGGHNHCSCDTCF